MNGRKRWRSQDRLPPFVALTWDMLNSQAYRKLKHSAAKALPYFLGKAKFTYNDPQRYLVDFTFPYKEGQRFGFAVSTFNKIIGELIRKGFVDPVDKGGLRSDCKSYNVFKLSRRWEEYGKKDFEIIEWQCFVPKPRLKTTPNSEMNNIKKGNKTHKEEPNVSRIDAV